MEMIFNVRVFLVVCNGVKEAEVTRVKASVCHRNNNTKYSITIVLELNTKLTVMLFGVFDLGGK